jgi:molybdate transport system regulatory protein
MEKNRVGYRYSHKRITHGDGKAMKLSYKVWLDHHGKAFGDGPYELLRQVDKTKSLHQAANQMGMAYSKARRLMRTLEQRLGFPLLDRKAGGPLWGLPNHPQAKELMSLYGKFRKEANDALGEIYQKHFGLSSHPIPLPTGESGRVRGRKGCK